MVDTGEMFYDSLDRLSLLDDESGIELWSNEFTCVEDRRKAFFSKMGFTDSNNPQSLEMELNRTSEITGAVSISCDSSSFSNRTVENWNNDMDDVTGDENVSIESEHMLEKKVRRYWWKKLLSFTRKESNNSKSPGISRIKKVQVNKKRIKELSALYTSQEFRAHRGAVWTAKFNRNGHYLATGGEDGVLRVWCITSTEACHGTQKLTFPVPFFIPDQVFQIKETPIHEFQGHDSEILDLAWSNSDLILSVSTDNTVRLWQVGSDECLRVFRHPNFVTCVQFNPVNDNYFVTGSVDGKIRVWGVLEGRVTEWDDAREALTAVSYQPCGEGMVAGLLNGSCRFYEASGSSLELSKQVQVSGSRITGIQFSGQDPERVIVTSEDSKVRVFEGTNVINKYRGLPKSGSQTSVSFTKSGKHMISVGEDSRVYLWEYNDGKEKQRAASKSTHSCEYFISQRVSVALPWGPGHERVVSSSGCAHEIRLKGSSRASATWPEEMLPLCGCDGVRSPLWGLVIVTASCDGIIRVFHNYSLFPIKA